MRVHPLCIFLSIPAILLACSSGGQGSPGSGPSPNAFGTPGATIPALSPINQSATTTVPEPIDSGRPDFGVPDTGGGGEDTGSDECSMWLKSSCSADPTPTSGQLATCRSQISGASSPPCPSQWRAYYQCISTNRVCDSATNRTDGSATAAACQTEQMAVSTCQSGGGA